MFYVLSLQGILDKVRTKIDQLEKAIRAQTEGCEEPCTSKCPIPVVSGECARGHSINVWEEMNNIVMIY